MAPSKAPRFIAYYRVSTQRQGASGLGLEAQEAAVAQYVASVGGRVGQFFREVESGRKTDRPALLSAIQMAKLTGSTLIIAKLDRLARNYGFLRQLRDAGLRFVCCDMPQANELTINILAAVAEDEALRISERTRAALAAAKARGAKLGGDRCGIAQHSAKGNAHSAQVRAESADQWAAEMREVIDAMNADAGGQLSLREVADRLNAAEYQTRRGGRWSATQVGRVLSRSGATTSR